MHKVRLIATRFCAALPLPPFPFSAALIASISLHAAAQPTDEDELALAYGDRSFVSIATGTRVPVARAPASATDALHPSRLMRRAMDH